MPEADCGTDATARGQLSLSLVEASLGVLLVLVAASTFAVTVPAPETEATRLDTLATDGLDVLGASPTDEATGGTLLTRLSASQSAFAQTRDDVRSRLHEAFPRTVRYRLETPHGTVGWTRPPSRPVGRARAVAPGGTVTLWVWEL